MRIEVHRIEDAEHFLANLRARARRPTDHLLIEDAAVDPPDEDEVGDGGDVDAGGEEVHRDDVFWPWIVLERLDAVERPIYRARDLLDEVGRLRAVQLLQGRAEFLHQDVGVVVTGCDVGSGVPAPLATPTR